MLLPDKQAEDAPIQHRRQVLKQPRARGQADIRCQRPFQVGDRDIDLLHHRFRRIVAGDGANRLIADKRRQIGPVERLDQPGQQDRIECRPVVPLGALGESAQARPLQPMGFGDLPKLLHDTAKPPHVVGQHVPRAEPAAGLVIGEAGQGVLTEQVAKPDDGLVDGLGHRTAADEDQILVEEMKHLAIELPHQIGEHVDSDADMVLATVMRLQT